GAPLILVGGANSRNAEILFEHVDNGLTVRTRRTNYVGLTPGLVGRHQYPNAACAIGAVEILAERMSFQMDYKAVRRGLETAQLPGRFEIVRRNPTVIMDGAHNAMAAAALAAEVSTLDHRRLLLVVGMTAGHSPQDFLEPLAARVHKLYATQPTWH